MTDYAEANKYPTKMITTQGKTDTASNYSVYVVWQNPDVQGSVTFDGFEAKLYWELTPPLATDESTDSGAWASEAAMLAAPPKLKMKFQDNITAKLRFDIKPGTAAASYSG